MKQAEEALFVNPTSRVRGFSLPSGSKQLISREGFTHVSSIEVVDLAT